jgi:hypothetical protein
MATETDNEPKVEELPEEVIIVSLFVCCFRDLSATEIDLDLGIDSSTVSVQL